MAMRLEAPTADAARKFWPSAAAADGAERGIIRGGGGGSGGDGWGGGGVNGGGERAETERGRLQRAGVGVNVAGGLASRGCRALGGEPPLSFILQRGVIVGAAGAAADDGRF